MKKVLIAFMIIGVIFNVANAKGVKIFDLKEQYFSQTMLKKGQDGYHKEAKYDLPKVVVTTDTIYNGHSYMFGLFTVDIKEALSDWSVNIKKKNGTNKYDSTVIRITSNNGNSHFVSFNDDSQDYIQIDNKHFKISNNMAKEIYTISISKRKNKMIFKIDGKIFLKTNSKDFGNLAKIEVELNDNYYDDELYALEIYKVK